MKPPSKIKSALNSGAMVGMGLMLLALITYVFEIYEQQWFGYLSWLVLVGGIVVGTKKYRDESLGGYISYGSALGYGVLLSLFAAIVAGFVNYIYLSFIDDSFLLFLAETTELEMYEKGMSDEEIEMAMGYSKMLMSATGIAFMGIFSTTILGFIFSLVTSAFLKKESDLFEGEEQ